jgi:hypothetical protein
MPRKKLRNWLAELQAVWRDWNAEIDKAHANSDAIAPLLAFPTPEDRAWLADPAQWITSDRSLGDYTRFALLSYLQWPAQGKNYNLAATLRLKHSEWSHYLGTDKATRQSMVRQLGAFDNPAAPTANSKDESRRASFSINLTGQAFWKKAADAINRHRTKMAHRTEVLFEVNANDLHTRRFAGHTAIEDFLYFINTGRIALRQAPFADNTRDLGAFLPSANHFKQKLDYFDSTKRKGTISALVEFFTERSADLAPGLRIANLWSGLEPHGLLAASQSFISEYVAKCILANTRRLPIIYIPVGMDATQRYVSRRAVVGDLVEKLCIERAKSRHERDIPALFPENPTGEETDAALRSIRQELARDPALLIFGIHHVPPGDRAPIDAEINDSPLPYLISRLMPEIGPLGLIETPVTEPFQFTQLANPSKAFGSQVLVLSDAPLEYLADLAVFAKELPACEAGDFPALLRAAGTHIVAQRLSELKGQSADHLFLESNELELGLLESGLRMPCLRDSDAITAAIRVVAEPDRARSDARVAQICETLLTQLSERAESNVDAAWLITFLHIVSLIPGGVRLFTAARIVATYILATYSSDATNWPEWLAAHESPLMPPNGAMSLKQVHDVVLQRLRELKKSAGGLLRQFPSSKAPGFDESDHPFEYPEAPALHFNFDQATQQIDYIAPRIRDSALECFQKRCPEKHALLCRLMAEEFIRRLAIVHCHRGDRDLRSLVDRRYCIIGIDLALRSLSHPVDPRHRIDRLLSPEGRARMRWLIPMLSQEGTFHWIYKWLYQEQLNSGEQALSQQLGAESLKRAILHRLEHVLESFPRAGAPLGRRMLRYFLARADILHSLLHVSVRISDRALATEMLAKLGKLEDEFNGKRTRVVSAMTESWRQEWSEASGLVGRRTAKLRLDVKVSYGMSHSSGTGRAALASYPEDEAVECFSEGLKCIWPDRAVQEPQIQKTVEVLKKALKDNVDQPCDMWDLEPTIRSFRRIVPRRFMQHFYDCLVRFAEMHASSADGLHDWTHRFARRQSSLLFFELAEALRNRYTMASASEGPVRVSGQPVRNAARVCLSLGRAAGDPHYFERAAYFCFHVIGNQTQHRVERVAVLLIQAMAARIRGLPGSFGTALSYLKEAERTLVNYPDRVGLFFRFYLERANLFLAQASNIRRQPEEAQDKLALLRCLQFSRLDAVALRRLARDRDAWLARADRLLERISAIAIDAPDNGVGAEMPVLRGIGRNVKVTH